MEGKQQPAPVTALTCRDIPTSGHGKPPAAGTERRLELRHPGGQWVAGEDWSQRHPLDQDLRKMLSVLELPGPHMEGRGSGAAESKEAETGDDHGHPLAVPGQDVIDRGDFQVPLHSPETEKEEPSRGTMQEKWRIAGPRGQITQPQADPGSLHKDNAQLEWEVQKLNPGLLAPEPYLRTSPAGQPAAIPGPAGETLGWPPAGPPCP